MDKSIYLNNMKKKLSGNYDIYENHSINENSYSLFCKYYERNERYIGLKSATIYAIENKEYVFFKEIENLTNKNFKSFTEELANHINSLITPNHEHMSSTITGVILYDNSIEKELIKKIEKFNFQKSFKLGLNGWVDIRIIAINLSEKKIIGSKKSTKVISYYSPTKVN